LQVGKVIADHHLEDGEELAIGDKAVLVDIVDLEGEAQFVLLVSAVEGGEACVGWGVPERN
jgi:hypothetical protein